MVYAIAAIAVLSFIVWAHHMASATKWIAYFNAIVLASHHARASA